MLAPRVFHKPEISYPKDGPYAIYVQLAIQFWRSYKGFTI